MHLESPNSVKCACGPGASLPLAHLAEFGKKRKGNDMKKYKKKKRENEIKRNKGLKVPPSFKNNFCRL